MVVPVRPRMAGPNVVTMSQRVPIENGCRASRPVQMKRDSIDRFRCLGALGDAGQMFFPSRRFPRR